MANKISVAVGDNDTIFVGPLAAGVVVVVANVVVAAAVVVVVVVVTAVLELVHAASPVKLDRAPTTPTSRAYFLVNFPPVRSEE